MTIRLSSLLVCALVATAACAPTPPPPPTAPPAAAAPTKPAAAAPTTAPAAPAASAAPAGSPAASPAAAPAVAPAVVASPSAAAPPAPAAAGAVAKPTGPLTNVRYGLPTSSVVLSTVGIYFAIDNGFMAEQGLSVTVTPYPADPTNMRALLSRDADIIETGSSTAYLAQASGAPIKIINSPVAKPTDSIVVTKDVTSFADLVGKTWAISSPGDPSQVQAQILARQAGLDPASINFVAIGGPPERATALIAGRAQAASMTILTLAPILDAIDKGDMHVLTTMAQAFPDLPLAYDVTRDDIVQGQADMLTRFVTAEIKGYRWAQQNPEQAAAIAGKYIQGVAPDLMVRGVKGLAGLKAWGLDGGVSADSSTRTQNLLVQTGALKVVVPPADILTTQFFDAANKTLGPPPP